VVLGGVAVEPEVSEGSASTGGGVGGRPRVTGERLGRTYDIAVAGLAAGAVNNLRRS
jgi:hypothetical protein